MSVISQTLLFCISKEFNCFQLIWKFCFTSHNLCTLSTFFISDKLLLPFFFTVIDSDDETKLKILHIVVFCGKLNVKTNEVIDFVSICRKYFDRKKTLRFVSVSNTGDVLTIFDWLTNKYNENRALWLHFDALGNQRNLFLTQNVLTNGKTN